jgi:hypothetical protein
MPAKGTGITKEDVRKAYHEAKNLKAKPSLEDILKILGRGSKGTIHTFMEEIRKEESLAAANSEKQDNFVPLIELVSSLLANSRIEAVRGMEERVNILESDIRELKTELEELSERYAVQSEQIEELVEKKFQSDVEVEIHRKLAKAYMEQNKNQYGDMMFVKGRLEQLQTDDDIHKDLKELIDSMTIIAARNPIEPDLNIVQTATSEEDSIEASAADSEGSKISSEGATGTESSQSCPAPVNELQEPSSDLPVGDGTMDENKDNQNKAKAPKSKNRT